MGGPLYRRLGYRIPEQTPEHGGRHRTDVGTAIRQ